MESILLDAEADSTTTEQLNALFRSMHTIKGSAGLFGLDIVVGFTHKVENVLDLLRDGALRLDDMLTGLLLRCHDHVKEMLTALAAKDSLERFADTETAGRADRLQRARGRRRRGSGCGGNNPAPGNTARSGPIRTSGRARRAKAGAVAAVAALWPGHVAQRHGPVFLHPLSRHHRRDRSDRSRHHPTAGRRRLQSGNQLSAPGGAVPQPGRTADAAGCLRIRPRRQRGPYLAVAAHFATTSADAGQRRAGGGRGGAGGMAALWPGTRDRRAGSRARRVLRDGGGNAAGGSRGIGAGGTFHRGPRSCSARRRGPGSPGSPRRRRQDLRRRQKRQAG
ncbi:Hpt domain-containing protein [Chromobacterium haemolyticum]|nr:Hpt domain-containing protein [Chromobacterium haemolyticum]